MGNRSFPFRALSTARTVRGNHFLTTKLLRLPAHLHFAYNPSNLGPPVLLRYLAVCTNWIRWLALQQSCLPRPASIKFYPAPATDFDDVNEEEPRGIG